MYTREQLVNFYTKVRQHGGYENAIKSGITLDKNEVILFIAKRPESIEELANADSKKIDGPTIGQIMLAMLISRRSGIHTVIKQIFAKPTSIIELYKRAYISSISTDYRAEHPYDFVITHDFKKYFMTEEELDCAGSYLFVLGKLYPESEYKQTNDMFEFAEWLESLDLSTASYLGRTKREIERQITYTVAKIKANPDKYTVQEIYDIYNNGYNGTIDMLYSDENAIKEHHCSLGPEIYDDYTVKPEDLYIPGLLSAVRRNNDDDDAKAFIIATSHPYRRRLCETPEDYKLVLLSQDRLTNTDLLFIRDKVPRSVIYDYLEDCISLGMEPQCEHLAVAADMSDDLRRRIEDRFPDLDIDHLIECGNSRIEEAELAIKKAEDRFKRRKEDKEKREAQKQKNLENLSVF